MALENEIGINLTIYFTFKPSVDDAPAQVAYWQEIIRRLGKYPNILCWEIMNEYVKNEDFQDIAGTWFHENDPDHRPVISSAGQLTMLVSPDKTMDGYGYCSYLYWQHPTIRSRMVVQSHCTECHVIWKTCIQ